ncbi:DNA-binding LytR/AlgR family response regulator [Pedobacter sp. AK013]|uniref:LytR/AlgR family response regulator transcription factor n=1 Tax=Pedobacter sp. AK013 TaxID=2723071 RepID=UPI001615E361|nr:response regulator transcription factor [Pedobacter sp. AK013]MBB6235433.1 DNA-binding LytR/AlgR family response regulator [Pedobacter sp. AK013]
MKVKCLLVDDEPLAIQLIQNHINQLDTFEVVGTCSNAIKALEMLRTIPVDLLFLDIKMPQITGIDFLKTLKNPPAVIITTAYREYAIEGYDLDLIDYLLKPITFDRFFKAVDRYLRLRGPIVKPEAIPVTAHQFIYIKTGGKFHNLNEDEVLYVESLKDYIVIHCTDRKVTAKYKISELETELQNSSFLRIHRSFIVNLKKVTAFTAYDIEIGTKELPIGASYKEYVFKKLQHATLK